MAKARSIRRYPVPASVTPIRKAQESRALATLLALSALALIPLSFIHTTFTVDWTNHTWLIGHFAAYFRSHLWFPVTVNSAEVIGMPYPVFYGFLFYPIAGILAALTGAVAAIRIIAAAALLWQAIEIWRTARWITSRDWLSAGIALLLSFGIYPLSNLYNRGALTEFVAAALLIVLVCRWLRFVVQHEGTALGIGLIFAMILGTHPITAVAGACAMAVIALLTMRWSSMRQFVVPALAVLVIASPFLYAYSRFGSHLEMSGVKGFYLEPSSIDRPLVRFSPIPYDMRFRWQAPEVISTPHMDAQFNEPLLLFCLVLLVLAVRSPHQKRWLRTGIAGLLCAAIVTIVSISLPIAQALTPMLQFLQFAYRLITYIDLFLLFSALTLLIALRPSLQKNARALTVALMVSLAWTAVCGTLKLTQPRYAAKPAAQLSAAQMPELFYGSAMYAVRAGFAPATGSVYMVSLPVDGELEVGALDVPATEGRILKTNVQAFPWNVLLRNGQPAPALVSDTFLALPSSPSVDRIAYRCSPDALWLALRLLSLLTFSGAFAYCCVRERLTRVADYADLQTPAA